ncbi:MAG: radical SAM protein [bacterium]|nr:radical SAM protein [bacterium]
MIKEKESITAFGFYDPHPANCIASWICPGATGTGYPEYTKTRGPETGCRNLAVYWGGCNYKCGFCQDWIHEIMRETGLPRFSREEVINWVDESTTCICFCGGTPDISMRRVVELAKDFRDRYSNRILRICAETNLTAPLDDLLEFAKIVKASGGGFNVGLKGGSEKVHMALTGHSNKIVWENFTTLYETFGPGKVTPFLRPSLVLIPNYIDSEEVQLVCKKISKIDPEIPLKFISFLPRRNFSESSPTEPAFMIEAIRIAASCGLKKISPAIEEIEAQKRLIR